MANLELEQLESFELRLALAETSVQLEKLLTIFLIPLLTKLKSDHPDIQNKVIALLSHISTRVKSEPQLQLPYSLLLNLLVSQDGTAMVRNFAFVYFELAFDRIASTSEKLKLLPDLITCFIQLPASLQSKMGVFILKCLALLTYPAPLTHPPFALEKITESHLDLSTLFMYFVEIVAHNELPKGVELHAFLVAKSNVILFTQHYLKSVQTTYWQKTLLFVTGACHADSTIAEHAETALKLSLPDYEQPLLVQVLLDKYLALKQDYTAKQKLLSILLKSKCAVNTFPKFVTIIYDSLFAPSVPPKLVVAGITLIIWAVQSTESTHFEKAGPLLVAALNKLLARTPIPAPDLTFSALGTLLKRVPTLINDQLLEKLFLRCRNQPPQELKLPLQSCLSTILSAMTVLPESLRPVLEECNDHPSEVYRMVSLQFAAKLCPQEPFAISLFLKCCDDAVLAIRQEAEAILTRKETSTTHDWPQLFTTLRSLAPQLSPTSLKASVDFLFLQLLLSLNYKRAHFLPDHYLREHVLATLVQSWIQSNTPLATDLVDYIVAAATCKNATQPLRAAYLSLLHFLTSLGAKPTLPLPAVLVEFFYETHSFRFKKWLLPLFQLQKQEVTISTTPTVEHRSSNLLLFSADFETFLKATEPPSETLLLQCLLFKIEKSALLPSVDPQLSPDWVQQHLFPLLHHETVDVAISAIHVLGALSRTRPELKSKVLDLFTKEYPKSSSAKKFHSVRLAVAESLCQMAIGQSATCHPFHRYVSLSDSSETLEEQVIQTILDMDVAVEPIRRMQLIYAEQCVLHVPHLPEKYVQDFHSLALKALLNTAFADSGSQVLMKIHLTYPELSPQFMPSVIRCIDSAPSAASTSASFLLFSCLVSVARELHQPTLACQLLQLTTLPGRTEKNTPPSTPISDALPKLPVDQLIPCLFRYQSHPVTAVAESVQQLVQVLLQGTPLVSHLPEIMLHLEKALNHSSVLVRETALLGIVELAKRYDPAIVSPYLTESFCKAALKLLDDTHPSVQQLAIRAGQFLCLHPNLHLILSFLMDGLKSVSVHVSKFCQSMLLKISQSPTPTQLPLLYPQIPSLVQVLLESLSSLEPQIFNYISFHVQSYEVTPEQLDAQRLALLRDSPTLRAVEALLARMQLSPTPDLDLQVAQALAHVLRTGIGVPTRGAVAKCILMLPSFGVGQESHAVLLKALSGAMFDTNATLAHWMVTAAASMARAVADPTLLKFLSHLQKVYVTSAPEKRALVVQFYLATTKIPSTKDRMQLHLVDIVPLIVLSMFAAQAKEKAEAKEVWQTYVHGDEAGIKLYAAELVPFLWAQVTETQDWTLQDQAAQALTWIDQTHPVSLTAPQWEQLAALAKSAKRDALSLLALHLALPDKTEFLEWWVRQSPSVPTAQCESLVQRCLHAPFHPRLVHVLSLLLDRPTPTFWAWYAFDAPFEDTVTCLLAFPPFTLATLQDLGLPQRLPAIPPHQLQSFFQVLEKAMQTDDKQVEIWVLEQCRSILPTVSNDALKDQLGSFIRKRQT